MATKTKPKNKSKFKGTVKVNRDRCKGCGICVQFCPRDVLELSRDFNVKGFHYPEVVHPDECIGCNLCGMYCPDFAIYAEKEKRSEEGGDEK